MAKYKCQSCGSFLRAAKKQGKTSKFISYKVFIVKKETHYKCPNGCELKSIQEYK